MTFLPTGPFTIAYALILAMVLAVVWWSGSRRLYPIAWVMAANWVLTRANTAWADDWTAIFTALTDTASLIAIAILARNRIGAAICGLFGIMLLFYMAHDLGFLGAEQMWAAVDVFAYLQLLIIVAGAIHDRGNMVVDHRVVSTIHRGGLIYTLDGGSEAAPLVESDHRQPRNHTSGARQID